MKLGGSVLTDKSRYKTPRPDAIARLAREVAGHDVVIVHGAGSYGHVLAKQHGLADGKGDPAAVARVHADVRELGLLVLRALHDAGVPAVWRSTLDTPDVAASARGARAAGLAPVFSGDVVLRGERWGILSGDAIMVDLARAMRPERAVFATDVDGIFDHWPGGALLPKVGAGAAAGAGPSADVTGSMAGKLARAREVARFAPVLVVNGAVPGRVADALAGRDVVGTRVETS